MNKTDTRSVLRTLGENDLPLVLRAHDACTYSGDAMSAEQIADGLRVGWIGGLALEGHGQRTVLCWQKGQSAALLTCFHREGSAEGFLGDCRRLLIRAEDVLTEWGVEKVYLSVSADNPRLPKLYKFFRRLGFEMDNVTLAKRV